MKLSLRSLPYWLAVPALVSVSATAPVHAHFKLLKPNAWIMEDAQGNPQKQGPCGTDPASATMTNEITEVKAGDEVMVEIQETIHHPGWFRISLAEDRSEFEEIKFENANCTYDMSTVPKEPHGNVLADGLEMDENLGGSNRKIMQMVKIPDKPCEKCTLQVIQVMADAVHSPPGCIYYHCADLKITGGGSGVAQPAAGSGGTAAASGSAGAAAGGSASAAGSSAAGSSASGTAGSASTTTTPAASAGTGAATAASKPAAPTSSGSAGSTGTRTSGASSSTSATAGKPASTGGTAGTTSASKTDDPAPAADAETKSDDGGCSVARSSAASDLSGAAWLAAVGLLLGVRRKRSVHN